MNFKQTATTKLKKIPTMISKNVFNNKGLIKRGKKWLVPAYVGSQLGFNEPGKIFIYKYFYPRLEKEAGVYALCPFLACSEYIGKIPSRLSAIEKHQNFWNNFNKLVGIINVEYLMPHSKFMIALVEGHSLDDGLCSEIADYARNFGPVLGIRSDVRLGENLGSSINPAVRYYMDLGPFKGLFINDSIDSYNKAIRIIKSVADKYR